MDTKQQKKSHSNSITISYRLRHNLPAIIEACVRVSDDGYVTVTDLIAFMSKQKKKIVLTVQEIESIVETDTKQRYSIIEKDGDKIIRANQGHNKSAKSIIDQHKLLTQLTEPLPICLYRTTESTLMFISESLGNKC